MSAVPIPTAATALRCAPWRAKRGRVVPGRRRRKRMAGVGVGAVGPGADVGHMHAHPTRRRAICGSGAKPASSTCDDVGVAPRTQGEPGHNSCRRAQSFWGLGRPKMYHEHGDTPSLDYRGTDRSPVTVPPVSPRRMGNGVVGCRGGGRWETEQTVLSVAGHFPMCDAQDRGGLRRAGSGRHHHGPQGALLEAPAEDILGGPGPFVPADGALRCADLLVVASLMLSPAFSIWSPACSTALSIPLPACSAAPSCFWQPDSAASNAPIATAVPIILTGFMTHTS